MANTPPSKHPKSVRRRLLQILYDKYLKDPLDMPTPEDILEVGTVDRADLLPNMFYLHDRGLIELMIGYNPPLFDAARILAPGIDLVENAYEFNLNFPPSPDEFDEAVADVPLLVEKLVQEADFAALDGEVRRTLRRDILYLRDELMRPPHRWRRPVIDRVLEWIEAQFAEDPDTRPDTLDHLKRRLDEAEG